ncbi:MAG: hypothetical protein FJ271_31910 [Planctomycetes bacterium]|nr:hypothetical protein [Planctomycetota bacterium]
MRSDMKKVLTERPRAGGGVKSPKGEKRQWQRCAAEDYPKSEKIQAKWTRSRSEKVFTDVLGPLYRFLLKQVGRKWDTVYGEIAQNLPKTSMQNIHVYTHLWQFVLKEVKIVDGEACYSTRRWEGQPIRSHGRYAQLYVNPKTGLLCKAKKGKRPIDYRFHRPVEPLTAGIKVYPGVQYHKVHGIWHEVEVRKISGEPVMAPLYPGYNVIKDDVLDRSYSNLEQLKLVYGGRYLAVSKRPLNKREIRFACLK